MKLLATQIIHFYKFLRAPTGLPPHITVLQPQSNPEGMRVSELFYKKYYSDNKKRRLIFGINPGRFGAGTTGINFTAPKQLLDFCDIRHSFKKQTELSAEFIYEMITAYGGCKKFYRDFILSAVSPLGFTASPTPPKEGLSKTQKDRKRRLVNINYYDDKDLMKAITPFIIDCINEQVSWNVDRSKCFCIGGDKNLKFLSSLNEKYKWFKEIIPLAHPRFIMQYRRKMKAKYIEEYLRLLGHKGHEGKHKGH